MKYLFKMNLKNIHSDYPVSNRNWILKWDQEVVMKIEDIQQFADGEWGIALRVMIQVQNVESQVTTTEDCNPTMHINKHRK